MPRSYRLFLTGAVHHIPWMWKTCQTMGKAGMPLSSTTAVTFPRLGGTRARASAEGIPSGANSPCTGEEVTWSPWVLIVRVHQGKAHLIHVQQRKDIYLIPGLIGGCSLQNRTEPSSFYHCGDGLGDSEGLRLYFQASGNYAVSKLEEKSCLQDSQPGTPSLVGLARNGRGMGNSGPYKAPTTKQVGSG